MNIKWIFSATALSVAAPLAPVGGAEFAAKPVAPKPVADEATDFPIAAGPFTSNLESLGQYRVPEWFRDAKFGIWSHWGPQAVPEMGDWYARKMYEEGSVDYRHHLKKYGHPSETGYKDIIPLWKAEKWNPDELMALYAKAGAKYFVALAVHHDNFDLWNSRFHRWNAVAMGPRRDIVGDWKKAALRQGLRFGVSEHLSVSYRWFRPSHGADTTGPLAGVPYDGADPKYQDLYHAAANSDDPDWPREWQRRIRDLVDNYQPDLLYSDSPIPFGEPGRSMIAHFYNSNIRNNAGRLEAVYNYKKEFRGTGVQDVERGALQNINPLPWQTDTSNGDWFYRANGRYKTTSQLIHSLADVVSKNGNMLLNVVQTADGSLPPESQQFLREMAAWMPINGEAIYGTRPWTIYGEGPTQLRNGIYNENVDYTAQDIRFTTKNGNLYAITLGVPTREVTIKSLAKNSPLVTGQPTQITLLGCAGQLNWTRTTEGLKIQLPPQLPCKHALSFKISGLQTAVASPNAAVKIPDPQP